MFCVGKFIVTLTAIKILSAAEQYPTIDIKCSVMNEKRTFDLDERLE